MNGSTPLRPLRLVALIPALLALAAASIALPADAAGSTIRGRVTDGGQPVPHIRVGWTDPVAGATALTRTDAAGRFSVKPPSRAGTGFLWAGLDPRADHVLFTSGSTRYVRAVVGAEPGRQGPLFQDRRPAAFAVLARRDSNPIRLLKASRLSGRNALLTGYRVVLTRGDGSRVDFMDADRSGRYRSKPLAPGRHHLRLRPPGSVAATPAGEVVLRSGRTTSITPGARARVLQRQSVVSGRVLAPSGLAGVSVRVEAWIGDDRVAAVRSDRRGRYRMAGLAPGRYTLIGGRNRPDFEADVPTTPPTPDDVVEASRAVVLRAGRTVSAALRLGAAGRIVGRTTATGYALVEDATGRLVRVGRIDDGRFVAGGLPTGTYRVVVKDLHRYAVSTVEVVAGRDRDVGQLTPSRALLTVRGTLPRVPRSRGERILAEAAMLGGLAPYDTAANRAGAAFEPGEDGRYEAAGIPPGLYGFRVRPYLTVGRTDESLPHAESSELRILVSPDTAARPVDLPIGPLQGRVEGTLVAPGGPALHYLPREVRAADGTVTGVSGDTNDATFSIWAPPGSYTWDGGADWYLALDGPWWASPRESTLTVEPGIERDARVPVVIRG